MTEELTVKEGGGDAARTGYWLVTGPTWGEDQWGTIWRHFGDVYTWEIHRRERNAYGARTRELGASTDAAGKLVPLPTLDEAVEAIRSAWSIEPLHGDPEEYERADADPNWRSVDEDL